MKKIGRFHVLTDTVLQNRYSHERVAEMAIQGGADTIQFRQKQGSTRELIDIALSVKKVCSRANVPLLINDRVDIALAVHADGVHLGQDDFPIAEARRLLGEESIIGGSAGNLEEAETCLAQGADYIGFGPVYVTGSKGDAGPSTGIERMKDVMMRVNLPFIGIGGIDSLKIPELMKAGLHGIALISAVCCADEPERAAREIKNILDMCLMQDK